MAKAFLFLEIIFMGVLFLASKLPAFEKDVFKTSQGDLEITCIGHGSLMISFSGKIIQIDPVGRYADYGQVQKADLILITHEHGDHLDPKAVERLRKADTELIASEKCKEKIPDAVVMKNGDTRVFRGIKIEAVPAYNIISLRAPGVPFHSKGEGNGYVLTFADQRLYVAGDTENIPEMAQLKDIDIAFLPMNVPYTMSLEMAAAAAKVIRPKILYPYHYGDTDTSKLVGLLKDQKDIEIRIRNMK